MQLPNWNQRKNGGRRDPIQVNKSQTGEVVADEPAHPAFLRRRVSNLVLSSGSVQFSSLALARTTSSGKNECQIIVCNDNIVT